MVYVSLREAGDRVKKARVLKVIEIAHKACKDLGIENPKVAVAGLNPHCGENGLFGVEEIEEIKPAIEAAIAIGIQTIRPIPPDSVFQKHRTDVLYQLFSRFTTSVSNSQHR